MVHLKLERAVLIGCVLHLLLEFQGTSTEHGVICIKHGSNCLAEAGEAGPPFYLGFSTAAPQIEGANATDGRGQSIWDTHEAIPGKIDNGDTGAVADDFYHRYPQDIEGMQLLGVKRFRMSISWSRVFPTGDNPLNRAGLDFYTRVLKALLKAGIEPHVTLYHWDLPQALQDRFGGWSNDMVVPLFTQYAATIFKELGELATYWTTVNEPWTVCFFGYGGGGHPPRINDKVQAWNCAYNVLQAHAAAVKQFRTLVPGGKISMNLVSDWSQPMTDSPADKDAAERRMEFRVGAFADPIYKGDFPAAVKQRITFLPKITPKLASDLNGSMDYIALNYYTSTYVVDQPGGTGLQGPIDFFETQTDRNGRLIGDEAGLAWIKITPWGLRLNLNWINNRYRPSEILVTENGVSLKGEDNLPLPGALQDKQRIKFFRDYIAAATDAVNIDKVPMKGYFAWSWLDNFEWAAGYKQRFGVVRVNYTTQQRHYKDSAKYLANLFNCTLLDPSYIYPSE